MKMRITLMSMFVVLGLFSIFVKLGKPMAVVPVLFIVTLLLAAVLGDRVAQCFSEPMNRRLRQTWGDGPERLGADDSQPTSP